MTHTFSGVPGDSKCECSDPGCPVDHKSKTQGCQSLATQILYRIDMEDKTGVAFCADCAEDAFASGMFTDSTDEDEEESGPCPECSCGAGDHYMTCSRREAF